MRTLIISRGDSPAAVDRLRDLIHATGGMDEPVLTSFDIADSSTFQCKADLCVVFLPDPPEHAGDLLPRLRRKLAGHLLAVGPISDPKVILRTLQQGADLFLDESALDTEFRAALRRLADRSDAPPPLGDLMAVVAASGGCGVSTLALNVAATLARDAGQCLLVDLNPGRGDLASMLDVRPQFSMADVCLNEERLDQAMIEKMIVRHPSGIKLLAAPPEFADSRSLSAAGVRRALGLARTLFAHTVVDLEDHFHDEQAEVLRQATSVLVTCRLDFASVRNTRRLLDALHAQGVARDRIKVAVNHAGLPHELPVTEAEDALGEKLTVFIPHDPTTINPALNMGQPVVLKSPESPVARSVMSIVTGTRKRRDRASGLIPNLKSLFSSLFVPSHKDA